jgi:hypothetical protein
MRDLDQAVPSDAPPAGAQLYVITLLSAPAPLALEPGTALPPHAGLSVFRTRRVRAGREEHLLQFGWFDSLTAAEGMLPSVRRRYPAAMVEAAPTGGMGSLDDTTVARFDLARAALAAGAPGADGGATGGGLGRGADRATVPRTGRPIEPPAPAPQRFAVQLAWSTTPFDLQRFGHPDTFAGHVLYRVHSERDGHRWYGLRLGFFRDHLAARLVLQQARRDFALAAVVPVSEREYARVIGAEAARQAT